MPTTVLLDGNIYDRLAADLQVRLRLGRLIGLGIVRVIATPVLVDELAASPFKGFPDWFPVEVEAESVFVWGHARWGMARYSEGQTYTEHRGQSNKIVDAIIADSANSLADVLVSDDRRCRTRLASLGGQCSVMNFEQFRAWLDQREIQFGRSAV